MESQTLGVYKLKTLLGRGGMGSVYLARDSRLDRDVALKVLSPLLANQKDFRDRFLSEARSSSALNHPNITTIHEIGEVDGAHFIAFEYVEGQTLESLLQQEGRLSPELVLELALPLSSGLGYAHERGIVHRDLKPANIVVSRLGIPKILDFGLAKTVAGTTEPESETLAKLTQAGMVVGTIAYMAPEQALGQTVDVRSDVFAFGCLLYEMLAGKVAFEGDTATQILDQLLHADPAPLDRLRPEIPSELAQITSKALRKDASARYQNMSELAADLRHVARQSGTYHEPSSLVKATRNEKPARRSRWLVNVAAAAGLIVAGALAFHGRRAVEPESAENTVAVMYFDNLSDPDDDEHTGRMLTELVTTELAGFESPGALAPAQVVSRQKLHDVAKTLGVAPGDVDRAIATELAKAAGVRIMIVGQVASAGGRIMASTELVDVASGHSLASQRASAADVEDIFLLAESLGEQVRSELERRAGLVLEDPGEAQAFPERATTSLEAYRHYVQGETHLDAGELEWAVEEFQDAIRLDPDFALAQFRLSMAARWLSDGPMAHQAARRAAALRDRVPSYLQGIIQANALYQDGAYSQAIPLLESELESGSSQTSEKESLYLLSQIYFHSLRDGDIAKAADLMERLLELDPDFHQVYDRLALAYAFMGETDKARVRMASWEASQPEKVVGLLSILATLEGQPEEALGFGQAFSWIEGPLFQAEAAMMAARWDIARRFVQLETGEWRADHLRAWSLRNRAAYHVYVGEFEEALEFYRQSGASSGLRTHEGGSSGVPASALQSMAELLYLMGDVGAARAEAERALSLQPESWRGLYFAGRAALWDEDPDAAVAYLDRLAALPASSTSRAARLYLHGLQGEILLEKGDASAARALFEPLVEEPLLLDWASTCSSAGAVFRDGLARTYLALDEPSRARQALEDLVASGAERLDHPAIYAMALYRLGVLYVEAGRKRDARRWLGRFLDMWSGRAADLPQIESARRLLDDSL